MHFFRPFIFDFFHGAWNARNNVKREENWAWNAKTTVKHEENGAKNTVKHAENGAWNAKNTVKHEKMEPAAPKML